MNIIGKITTRKVFAYNFLYTQLKKDGEKLYESENTQNIRDYIMLLYRKLLNITSKASYSTKFDFSELQTEVFIQKRENKKVILIEFPNAREIYGVTNVGIVFENNNSYRYFIKLNKLAYVDDTYGNLLEVVNDNLVKMVTIVEDYQNDKIMNSLFEITSGNENNTEINSNINIEKYESTNEAKIFYINNWITKSGNLFKIFDICDTSDRNRINFFAKILNNKLFEYKTVTIDESSRVVECKRCGISPCPINTYLQIMQDYPGNEYIAFNIKATEKPELEDSENKLKFLDDFDNLSLLIAQFLITNNLVKILEIKDDVVKFEMAEFEEELEENEKISPVKIIKDFSEDVIEKKVVEFNVNDIEKIKEKYSVTLNNNPYLLSAYMLYKSSVDNILMVYMYEKINSNANIEKAKDDLKVRLNIEKIEKLYLEENSKKELIKMVEYAQKYSSGEALTYIPFNMRIYADNMKIVNKILDILMDSFSYFKYLSNREKVEKSFHSIYDQNDIAKLYENAKYAYIILRETEGLNNQERITKQRILNELEEKIKENSSSTLTIITDLNKNKIDEAIYLNSVVKDKIFDYELYTRQATENEVYQELIDSLDAEYELDDKFKAALLSYIEATYSKRTVSYVEYIQMTYERISFNNGKNNLLTEDVIPEYEKDKSLEDIFKELNELVGLDNVKQMLKDLSDLIEFKLKTEGNLNLKETNLHMVFLGNPGTGKTTVARMIAGILYHLKYVKQNKLVEVSAKDLVGQYVGQTAPKTMEVVEKALGGVLFIDEAYSLASKEDKESSFNAECIATLIQAMENYRDNLVVIFAGYKKEMQDFLNSNSGIVSRIGYTMDFKDYTTDELIQIFNTMVKKAGFDAKEDVIEKIKDIINEYKENENFGNARFVRNLYEKIVIKHASNTKNETDMKVLKTITSKDISLDTMFLGI